MFLFRRLQHGELHQAIVFGYREGICQLVRESH